MIVDEKTISDIILKALQNAPEGPRRPALAYDRVSTEEQRKSGLSLDYQSDRARRYAEDAGLYIAYGFSAAESAFKEGRKKFNLMLNLAERFGIRDIIFKNTDRLSRNDIDWPRCKRLAKEGMSIHLYELGTVLNQNSTAEEEMFLDNTSVMARYWSNKISQGTRASNRYKAENGIAVFGSSPPLGYFYDKKLKQYIIDTESEEQMRFIFDEYDKNTYSVRQFTDIVNARGYRTARGSLYQSTTMYRTLTNPFYHGEFTYDGKIWPGTHETYYDKQRYLERRKSISINRSCRQLKKNDFMFRQMLKCGLCGKTLTGDLKKCDNMYYMHRCFRDRKAVYIPEKKIISMIDQAVESVRLDEGYADFLKDLIGSFLDERKNVAKGQAISLSKRIQGLKRENDRLLELLVKGVDEETVTDRMNRNRADIEELKVQQTTFQVDKNSLMPDISETISSCAKFQFTYSNLEEDDKFDFLKIYADKITIFSDYAEIQFKKPFSFIFIPEIIGNQNIVRTKTFMGD